MKRMILSLAIASICATACNPVKETGRVPALDYSNLDTLTAPGADFYQYATGGWQKNNPLKPEFSRYGAFDILAENNEIRLNDLFKGLVSLKTKAGSVERKISDLYKMGLDSARLNTEGAAPLEKYLAKIETEVVDARSFARLSAECERNGAGGLYGCYAEADLANSDVEVLYIGESGLSMGNRDYYLLEQHAAIREGFKRYLVRIFELAGYEDAASRAQDAYDVQMAIAEPFWSMVQQRDIQAMYNPMSSEEIVTAYPFLCFDEYFKAMGIEPQDKVILEQPSYFKAINELAFILKPDQLKHFLQAHVIENACSALGDEFYAASFDFFSRQMAGTKEPKPRWKRAMNVPNRLLGEAVGQMYVEKYFPEEAKSKMLAIVKNIQAALGEHIDSLDWMSDATKAKAHEKLDNFTVKIGYPDKWKDYSSLEINPQMSYLDNICAASRWYTEDNLSKLGKPVDKEEWGMTPQTVNAYYNPTTNEICFPAGILQPPFFNPDADDAVNYGAIGVVISHEMTHGFDDQGRLFDKDGNMNNWWAKEDEQAFNAKTAKLVEQFNSVEVLPGVFANGAATLGENIADQGGLRIAFTAMQNSFEGKTPEPIDGFSAEQRFYLAYATVWAQNITDEEIQRRTLIDVHSLGKNRVNVSVRNLDTFFSAFGIKEGDAMWRPESERVIIW
ncbi:MAG: M13 family metallopeptidase [Bacteroidales bacterium]|nr:M13 family metallopeptidase [Candidatus Cryptobacteroides fimicaballi]